MFYFNELKQSETEFDQRLYAFNIFFPFICYNNQNLKLKFNRSRHFSTIRIPLSFDFKKNLTTCLKYDRYTNNFS